MANFICVDSSLFLASVSREYASRHLFSLELPPKSACIGEFRLLSCRKEINADILLLPSLEEGIRKAT